jgi:hypothetical protein
MEKQIAVGHTKRTKRTLNVDEPDKSEIKPGQNWTEAGRNPDKT